MLSREFACRSEGRLQRISKWHRDQAGTFSLLLARMDA